MSPKASLGPTFLKVDLNQKIKLGMNVRISEECFSYLIRPITRPTISPQNAPGSFVLGQNIARR